MAFRIFRLPTRIVSHHSSIVAANSWTESKDRSKCFVRFPVTKWLRQAYLFCVSKPSPLYKGRWTKVLEKKRFNVSLLPTRDTVPYKEYTYSATSKRDHWTRAPWYTYCKALLWKWPDCKSETSFVIMPLTKWRDR